MTKDINNEIEKTLSLLDEPENIEISSDFADIICRRVMGTSESKTISVCPRKQDIPQSRTIKLDNSSFYFKAAVLLLALNVAAVVTLFITNKSSSTETSTETYASVMADEYLSGSGYSISY